MQVRFTLIKCEPAKTNDVADEIVQLVEASEIYTLLGDHDLLVKFRIADCDQQVFEKFIDDKVRKIEGVRETNTLATQPWFV